jgi:hypothetical protein
VPAAVVLSFFIHRAALLAKDRPEQFKAADGWFRCTSQSVRERLCMGAGRFQKAGRRLEKMGLIDRQRRDWSEMWVKVLV